ncbi:MAG: adenylate/guanylate cyclase domain-containing protein [Gammaproteobacteria bacterium]|nr:adenylate/guanylate cyclase domain-containing protein [Gammaproteobacteria bacterium]
MGTSVDIIAVMFADVAGSTTLYEQLGDTQANRIIDDVLNMMSEVTVKNSGTVVKTIGDEVMCVFKTADQALTAASIIQEMLKKRPTENGFKIRVRIGFHLGQALVRDDGDVFGDAVNVAARVAGIAQGNQIITTKETVDTLNPFLRSNCREFDRIQLKGKSEETIISEVVWETDDVTRMSTMVNFINAKPVAKQLHLKYLEKEMILSPDSPVITLGRGPQCDFIINSSHASRMHARIEFRRGKFVIIDQSTNGTFVKNDDGKEVYLRREELPLLGSGVITLGMNLQQDNPHQLYFSV